MHNFINSIDRTGEKLRTISVITNHHQIYLVYETLHFISYHLWKLISILNEMMENLYPTTLIMLLIKLQSLKALNFISWIHDLFYCKCVFNCYCFHFQVGNMIFWSFFCIFGQPMCVLLYYHDVMNRRIKSNVWEHILLD